MILLSRTFYSFSTFQLSQFCLKCLIRQAIFFIWFILPTLAGSKKNNYIEKKKVKVIYSKFLRLHGYLFPDYNLRSVLD